MRRFLFWLMITAFGIGLGLLVYALDIPFKVFRWYRGE